MSETFQKSQRKLECDNLNRVNFNLVMLIFLSNGVYKHTKFQVLQLQPVFGAGILMQRCKH